MEETNSNDVYSGGDEHEPSFDYIKRGISSAAKTVGTTSKVILTNPALASTAGMATGLAVSAASKGKIKPTQAMQIGTTIGETAGNVGQAYQQQAPQAATTPPAASPAIPQYQSSALTTTPAAPFTPEQLALAKAQLDAMNAPAAPSAEQSLSSSPPSTTYGGGDAGTASTIGGDAGTADSSLTNKRQSPNALLFYQSAIIGGLSHKKSDFIPKLVIAFMIVFLIYMAWKPDEADELITKITSHMKSFLRKFGINIKEESDNSQSKE